MRRMFAEAGLRTCTLAPLLLTQAILQRYASGGLSAARMAQRDLMAGLMGFVQRSQDSNSSQPKWCLAIHGRLPSRREPIACRCASIPDHQRLESGNTKVPALTIAMLPVRRRSRTFRAAEPAEPGLDSSRPAVWCRHPGSSGSSCRRTSADFPQPWCACCQQS